MARPAARPNVLWIYCDELRADALSCYGNRQLSTPNLDSLADSGTRFENFFVNSPICVPSRTATLTGRLPTATGVYGNEGGFEGFELRRRWSTFTEAFAQSGYSTANFGKSHVPRSMTPWTHHDPGGADPLGIFRAGAAEDFHLLRAPTSRDIVAGEMPADLPFPGNAVTERTLSFLSSCEQPFFIRASYLQPHTPVLVPRETLGTCSDAAFRSAPFPPEEVSISRFESRFGEVCGGRELSPADFLRAQRAYHEVVAWIDIQVGRLLSGLREKGVAQDTVVVFTSDHGAHLGEFGAYAKHTFAPWVQKVPLLISWPGHLSAGATRRDLGSSVDLGPTLLSLAAIDSSFESDGTDLFGAARGQDEREVVAVIGHGQPGNLAFPAMQHGTYVDGRGWPRRACLRVGRYRYDRNVLIDGRPPTAEADVDAFLADVEADPSETENLAGRQDHAATVQDMERRLAGRLQGMAEPLAYAARPPAAVGEWKRLTGMSAEGEGS